jgi:pantothenate kinase
VKEYLVPPRLPDPLTHLEILRAHTTTRIMVGIAGTPGAGKSTLAMQSTTALNVRHGMGTALALGMDGFHLSKAQLRQLPNPDEAFARRGHRGHLMRRDLCKHSRRCVRRQE